MTNGVTIDSPYDQTIKCESCGGIMKCFHYERPWYLRSKRRWTEAYYSFSCDDCDANETMTASELGIDNG